MESLRARLIDWQARRDRRRRDAAHTRALRARDEMDARRSERAYQSELVLPGRITTALTGCRRVIDATGTTEVHAHGCTHRG